MTDDLISRQAALEKVRTMQTYKLFMGDDMILVDKAEVQTELMMLPSAQRTGRWKVSELPKGKMKYCSECGFGQYIADERQYNFCPNCGAKMDEEIEGRKK